MLFQKRLKKALWQMPALFFAACFLALASNHLRSDSIPLVGDWSVNARFADAAGDSLVIGLDEAGRLFERQAALFLDARPQSQYAQGHIRGALNLPWQEADHYVMELADQLEGAAMIVTYCDGDQCDLSHELALLLKVMGFESVRVLVNGWSVWQQAGLPTDRKG